MNVLNYHPEVIEKEFEELKSNVEKINVNAKKKFKTRMLLLLLICIITLAMAIVFVLQCGTNDTKEIAMIVFSVIAFASFCVAAMFFLGIVIDGPDVLSLSYQLTFAMKFHNLYSKTNVLSIELDEEAKNCVVILYENDHHFVRKETIMARDIIMSTEVNETILDVGRGFILQPYTSCQKPKIINQ